jgi:5-deoxy-glucuronate isomerase
LQYLSDTLVVRPREVDGRDSDLIVEVTPGRAGWDYIHFQARRLEAGGRWSFQNADQEMVVVVLSGSVTAETDRGRWAKVGGRANVFSGPPHALYVPRGTAGCLSAEGYCEFAAAWAPANRDRVPRLITPAEVRREIRGGGNMSRQIHEVIPPGFECDRLVVVEVFTPGGNWSSYPPHKHDARRLDSAGRLIEADLEEIYYYRFDRPAGYAYQRVYTGENSPLQEAGFPIDAVVVVREHEVVLVPEGYHPVVSPPGYTTYYLNVLAGSDQVLTASEDPRYAWIKQTYGAPDPRLPLYGRE